MEKTLQYADRRLRGELEQQLKVLTAQIESLRPTAAAITRRGEEDARRKIEEDARRATEAFNQLFQQQLQPLPVELLPAHEANAYTDGAKFFAPPAIAQLPEITWHNMSWQGVVNLFTLMQLYERSRRDLTSSVLQAARAEIVISCQI